MRHILGDRRRTIDKKLQHGEKSLNVDAGPGETQRGIQGGVQRQLGAGLDEPLNELA